MAFSLAVRFSTITNNKVRNATWSSLAYSGLMVINMLLAAIALSQSPDSLGTRTLITFLFTILWPIVLGIHLIYQAEAWRQPTTAITPQDLAADDASSWYPALACIVCVFLYLPVMKLLGLVGAGFIVVNAVFAYLERRYIP